jgi:signal transduction histidine kinase/ActR/RegA family two-component response regulator/putative methionine-R-sulfoxide reductase with GAF domain
MGVNGEVQGDDGAPANAAYVYARLQRLYEVSKHFAEFVSIEASLPGVLEVIASALPLASAVLLLEVAGECRTFVWAADGLPADRMTAALKGARAAYDYLVRPAPSLLGRADAAGTAEAPVVARAIPGVPQARLSEPFDSSPIALPLVTRRRRTFGVFQLEIAAALEPSDLLFADGLANQLAIALDRDRVQLAEQAARLDAERATQRLRALLRIWEPLLESPTLDEALPRLLEPLREMFAADVAVLLLLHAEDNVLRVRAHVGLDGAGRAAVRIGSGVAGRVVSAAAPLVFNDAEQLREASPILYADGIRAAIGVPLRVHGQITGVLEVASHSGREFSEDDVRLLEVVADRVALGVERARLFDRERQFATRLQILSEEAVKIADIVWQSSPDLTVIFQSIVAAARAVSAADYAALGIGTEPDKPFDPWVFSGISSQQAAQIGPMPRPLGLLGLVPRETVSCRLSDMRQHAAFRGWPANHPDMGPFLGVPVRHRGHTVGNIYLTRDAGREPFTEEDQRAIELLAAHAGVAMENVRLYSIALESARRRELMTAVVSHDLRNPLAAISLTADVLLQTRGPTPDRRSVGRRQVEAIKRQTNRMLRLIRDLLDAASLESGNLTLATETTLVRSIADEVLEDFVGVAGGRSVRLETQLSDDDLSFRVDRDRIMQVLSNLIGNALKFTAAGGVVSVRAERLGADIRFTVADTGCGMPHEHLSHVFDRYWQASETARLGSGLGLSIAKGIVETHGGRIWVESTVGVGTSFHFTIPIGPASAGDAGTPLPRNGEFNRGVRLLVVDDEEMALSALAVLLAEEGFVVETAGDAMGGIAKLESFVPDVLVTDLKMPRLDGAILIDRAREKRPGLPVIIMSGLAGAADRAATLPLTEYVGKPIEIEKLVRAIGRLRGESRAGEVLAQHRALDRAIHREPGEIV